MLQPPSHTAWTCNELVGIMNKMPHQFELGMQYWQETSITMHRMNASHAASSPPGKIM